MNHDLVAPVYDFLGVLWTGGAIGAAKRLAAATAQAGDRVLFAGVGTGRDAAVAVERGAQVTGVDLSGRMLSRASRRCGPGFRALREDVLEHDPGEGYDLVCAHYFLNVFGPSRAPEVLDHLAGFVRPGGRLAVADFAPGAGLLRSVHYRVPATVFGLLGLCAEHPIYDYSPMLAAAELEVETHDVRIFGVGPAFHRVWIGTRGARG